MVNLGGVFFWPFVGLIGAPGVMEVWPWPPGTLMRPEDAVNGVSGKFFAAVT